MVVAELVDRYLDLARRTNGIEREKELVLRERDADDLAKEREMTKQEANGVLDNADGDLLEYVWVEKEGGSVRYFSEPVRAVKPLRNAREVIKHLGFIDQATTARRKKTELANAALDVLYDAASVRVAGAISRNDELRRKGTFVYDVDLANESFVDALDEVLEEGKKVLEFLPEEKEGVRSKAIEGRKGYWRGFLVDRVNLCAGGGITPERLVRDYKFVGRRFDLEFDESDFDKQKIRTGKGLGFIPLIDYVYVSAISRTLGNLEGAARDRSANLVLSPSDFERYFGGEDESDNSLGTAGSLRESELRSLVLDGGIQEGFESVEEQVLGYLEEAGLNAETIVNMTRTLGEIEGRFYFEVSMRLAEGFGRYIENMEEPLERGVFYSQFEDVKKIAEEYADEASLNARVRGLMDNSFSQIEGRYVTQRLTTASN